MNQVDMEVLAEADRRRAVAAKRLSEDSRRSLSQFFTPAATARRLAGLIDLSSLDGNGSLRVLFPSAGTGMLPAAVAEAVLGHGGATSGLRFVCVEIDGRLLCPLEATLADVQAVLPGSVTEAVHADFVKLAATWLQPRVGDLAVGDAETSASAVTGDGFDLVVMNPPYAKLGRRSPAAVTFRSVGVQVPNLYAGFVQAAMMMLRPGGQLIAVTPRSFVNGAYFRDFRRAMLALGGVADVVVPESRTEAFADDGVLQEIVMYRMVAGKRPVTVRVERDRPVRGTVACSYPTDVIVDPGDRQQRIVTPHSPAEAAFRATVSAKLSTVAEIGVTAAAGKTVPHRVRAHLRCSSHDGLPPAASGDLLEAACDLFDGPSPLPAAVPLLRTAHLRGGRVRWPVCNNDDAVSGESFHGDARARGSGAADLLAVTPDTVGMLWRTTSCVVTRRISFPEARSRVVAAVLTPDDVPGEWFAAALELYVLTLPSRSSPDAAWGLAVWLTSTAADRCIRPTLGSTHVNGSDLESLPCPPVDVLAELGASVRDHVTLGRVAADCVVERCLPWLSTGAASS